MNSTFTFLEGNTCLLNTQKFTSLILDRKLIKQYFEVSPLMHHPRSIDLFKIILGNAATTMIFQVDVTLYLFYFQ